MKKVLKIIAVVLLICTLGVSGFASYHLYERQKLTDKFLETNYGISLNEWNGDALMGKVHKIYSDKAVVNAYKTGETSNLSNQDKYVLKKAKEVINENIKKGMSDYEKELAIYNWQVKYISYDEDNYSALPNDADNYSHLPYGVLKYHKSICVGNATTFKLFMDLLGIECKIIHSTANGEHAWDLVKIGGDWYHVDITFDSGVGSTSKMPGYDYFNVPDCVKKNMEYTWNSENYPKATSTKYCYAVMNCVDLNNVYELPAEIKKAMNSNKHTLFINIKDTSLKQQDLTNEVDSICLMIPGENSVSETLLKFKDKNMYSIRITKNENDNTEPNKNIDYNKLQSAVKKVFGYTNNYNY